MSPVPFAVRGDLPVSLKTAVKNALLSMKDNPQFVAASKRWFLDPNQEKGLPNLDAYYNPLREIAKNVDLAADYHAPSILASAFRVFQEGWAMLPAAVRMVTLNAARAVGLNDRGALQAGLRADLIVVDLDEVGYPHVRAS
jgi:hypothetical protein